jgi:hypothetical protein
VNTDYQLWDDARRLVALNRELRSGTYTRFLPAWPLHFYDVGDPHGDEMIAIDIRNPAGPVGGWIAALSSTRRVIFRTLDFRTGVEKSYRGVRDDLTDRRVLCDLLPLDEE